MLSALIATRTVLQLCCKTRVPAVNRWKGGYGELDAMVLLRMMTALAYLLNCGDDCPNHAPVARGAVHILRWRKEL